ncbi:prospero homeobox protein 2 [Sorex araneus]|uniref:prospero homeobox protein 2 n=1 Tax=Sorex araneus TaxID=42254 RepID=UPI002433B607|nr:prospero homeobox protein 2 [Sorex araneus]
MEPDAGLHSPPLTEPCMEVGGSPQGRDPPIPRSQGPSSSLADPDRFGDEHIQAKRARVETIVRGMGLPASPLGSSSNPATGAGPCCVEKVRERKRKQSVPTQQGHLQPGPAGGRGSRKRGSRVREELQLLKQQLRLVQERLLPAAQPIGPMNGCGTRPWTQGDSRWQGLSKNLSRAEERGACELGAQAEEARLLPPGAQALLAILRKELSSAMSQAVDSVLQKFNRCITSQMIKWFSNFREFYYIQMEKSARQAISDGVTNAQTLVVLRDSDLFRTLNMHYNKGNDFEVPEGFLEMASLTLQEFFKAVSTGKDADPSWKKPIYKIISKLDSDIPEIFKSSNYPQELFRN